MNLLDKIGREFSGYNLLESGKRIFDRKPMQCSLYLTDKCNLDCSYCTEYDNSKPHPKLEDLKLSIADADRGEFASDEEMAETWKKFSR